MGEGISSASEEALVIEYSQLVRRVIRPFFLRGGDYDDLYQEGMLGLLSAIRSYDDARGGFDAYAAMCIKRRVIDAVRRDNARMRRNETQADLPLEYAAAAAEERVSDPEVSILANETAKEITSTLAGMLSPFEAAVLDRYLDGYTSSEIANRSKRSRKSVDNAIRRIRRKLALYLSGRR